MDGSSASGIGGSVLRRLGRSVAAGLRSWRRRQREWALLRELQALDDHILKDIGYRRDELLLAVRETPEAEPAEEEPARKTSKRTTCRRLCSAPLRSCSA
jgi:uncharacterized protein YjiS (DUF1127 family)